MILLNLKGLKTITIKTNYCEYTKNFFRSTKNINYFLILFF